MKAEDANQKYLLTEKEAAQFLGLSPGTLRVGRCTGRKKGKAFPPYYKLGRTIRYRRDTLIKWVEKCAVTEPDAES